MIWMQIVPSSVMCNGGSLIMMEEDAENIKKTQQHVAGYTYSLG
jgi:hypothetical protein